MRQNDGKATRKNAESLWVLNIYNGIYKKRPTA